MSRFALMAGTVGVVAMAMLGSAGIANAAPLEGMSAADTARVLQEQGYSVQFNGTVRGPLSRCLVTGVHGLSGAMPMSAAEFDTVYVDVTCPTYSY